MFRFRCNCCGGISWDNGVAALAGKPRLSAHDVMHSQYCPGVSFPDNHVTREEVTPA